MRLTHLYLVGHVFMVGHLLPSANETKPPYFPAECSRETKMTVYTLTEVVPLVLPPLSLANINLAS